MRKSSLFLMIGVGAVAGIAYAGYHTMYAAPRQKLMDDLSASRGNLASMKTTLKGEVELDQRGRQIGATTLGVKLDTVLHRFRTGLSRIGEQEGLVNVVVDGAQKANDQMNPLLTTKGVATSLKTALRKVADFQVIEGSLKGTGSLEQVLRVVSVVQAQPWLHRVKGFELTPVGSQRDKFVLRVDVATLYIPDLVGKDSPVPQIVQPPTDVEPMWRAIAMKNVFKNPPGTAEVDRPVVVVAGPPAGDPPANPPAQVFPPYDEWRLAGIVTGGRGPEAFFVNERTSAKLTIARGGVIVDAVFVEGEGERAVLEIQGKKYEIKNGQTLAARRPVGSV